MKIRSEDTAQGGQVGSFLRHATIAGGIAISRRHLEVRAGLTSNFEFAKGPPDLIVTFRKLDVSIGVQVRPELNSVPGIPMVAPTKIKLGQIVLVDDS